MAARQRDLPSAEMIEMDVRVAHSSPGRLRLRVGKSEIEAGTAGEAASAFEVQHGVILARVNETARSIVVHYDDRATNLEQLNEGLESAGIRLVIATAAAAELLPSGHTPLSHWVSRKAGAADERIRSASGGSADLRTLVPLSLAALAAREIFSGRGTAVPWYALAWYAFDSFIKLKRPNDTTDKRAL